MRQAYVEDTSGKTIATIVGTVVAGIVALSLIGGTIYTVDQGEQGTVLRNGEAISLSGAGLHFKIPIIDEVVFMSTREHLIEIKDLWLYSFDQQNATADITINYSLLAEPMLTTYGDYGSREAYVTTVIIPKIYPTVKNVFGRYTAVRAIQERSTLEAEISAAIRLVVGIELSEIISVQLKNVDFSDAYETSVEERMLAEVEVQKIRQNAEREKVQAEILVIQAQAKADALVATAEAEAAAIILVGEAEATAIEARGNALNDNPDIIGLVQAERWNGILPTTMLPNGTVPFLDVTN